MIKKRAKIICLCLALILLCGMLISCKSRPLSPDALSKKEVGKVGSHTVYYDELYFLASNYNTDGIGADALVDTVYKNIIENYAILDLCTEAGVTYDAQELEDDVQEYIDELIEDDFGGDRGKYIKSLEQNGLTDRYVRFIAKTDLYYSKLITALINSGKISTDEESVCEYLLEHCIRTRHVMIADNKGDDAVANMQTAQDMLASLRGGTLSMYDAIGGKYNEDFTYSPYDNTFGKGVMEKQYENAAFSLSVGEFSDVISFERTLDSGEHATCHFIIQRIELSEEFILDNYSYLYQSYTDTVIAGMLQGEREKLTFVPNEYCRSLDLQALKATSAGTDTFRVIAICTATVIGVCAIAVVTVLLIKFNKNANKAKKDKALPEKSNF